MERFEYKIVSLEDALNEPNHFRLSTVQALLNRYGKEGWVLVQLGGDSPRSENGFETAVFRRKLEP